MGNPSFLNIHIYQSLPTESSLKICLTCARGNNSCPLNRRINLLQNLHKILLNPRSLVNPLVTFLIPRLVSFLGIFSGKVRGVTRGSVLCCVASLLIPPSSLCTILICASSSLTKLISPSTLDTIFYRPPTAFNQSPYWSSIVTPFFYATKKPAQCFKSCPTNLQK